MSFYLIKRYNNCYGDNIKFLFCYSIIILVFLFTMNLLSSAYAQKFKDVEISVDQLTNGTFILTGKGGNIGLSIGKDGILLIDSQFKQLSDKIIAAIGKITDKPIRFVINTHWHQDHNDGNENLANKGAIIIAHENVLKRLTNDQFVEFLNREYNPPSSKSLPTITYDNQSITIDFNEDKIDIYHIPNAHTDGDSIIYFNNNNIIHTGDIFVNGRYPFIDRSSGGSIDGLITGIEKTISLINDDTQIIPGHGPISNLHELQDYLHMLKDLRQQVQYMVNDGASLDQIVKSSIADNYSLYSDSFISSEDFLGFVYNDLIRKQ